MLLDGATMCCVLVVGSDLGRLKNLIEVGAYSTMSVKVVLGLSFGIIKARLVVNVM